MSQHLFCDSSTSDKSCYFSRSCFSSSLLPSSLHYFSFIQPPWFSQTLRHLSHVHVKPPCDWTLFQFPYQHTEWLSIETWTFTFESHSVVRGFLTVRMLLDFTSASLSLWPHETLWRVIWGLSMCIQTGTHTHAGVFPSRQLVSTFLLICILA